MLNSSDAKDRREGVQIVKEIRVAEGPSKSKVRVFEKKDYEINIAADSLLTLSKTMSDGRYRTEPPVTVRLSDLELETFLHHLST